ncbi:hypothetical protein Ptc2401_01466 [Prosthecochloris sp. CIB 2401]|nr:hypothetical protein Ptc2401_01466 [Prosthecochloris sp. CIB 2401]
MASLYKGGDETIFLYKRQSEHYRLPFAFMGRSGYMTPLVDGTVVPVIRTAILSA